MTTKSADLRPVKSETLKLAKQVLRQEASAIMAIVSTINDNFFNAVELILQTKGRVIVTGMGKPGYIARKLSATLMSTGTPAFYLHPAEAMHGDLGCITKDDTIIILSNSGETAEIINILPTIKQINIPLISICGNPLSTLARFATYNLNAHITQEACPLNLAPTTSTRVQLALSDALAISVMQAKKLSKDDFAFYHPGGSLGQIRLMTVKQLVRNYERQIAITAEKSISEAIFVMTNAGIGAVAIVDKGNTLLGIITDGDIRRQLNHYPNLLNIKVSQLMVSSPITIEPHKFVADALNIMQQHQPRPITVLPVIDDNNKFIGMIHITDIYH